MSSIEKNNGNLDMAEQLYQRAIELGPNESAPRVGLARILADRGWTRPEGLEVPEADVRTWARNTDRRFDLVLLALPDAQLGHRDASVSGWSVAQQLHHAIAVGSIQFLVQLAGAAIGQLTRIAPFG